MVSLIYRLRKYSNYKNTHRKCCDHVYHAYGTAVPGSDDNRVFHDVFVYIKNVCMIMGCSPRSPVEPVKEYVAHACHNILLSPGRGTAGTTGSGHRDPLEMSRFPRFLTFSHKAFSICSPGNTEKNVRRVYPEQQVLAARHDVASGLRGRIRGSHGSKRVARDANSRRGGQS